MAIPKTTKKELKTAVLNLRFRPTYKALAESMAYDDDKSLTQFLEWLVGEELKRRVAAKLEGKLEGDTVMELAGEYFLLKGRPGN